MTYIVYEYTEKASPLYQGTRFMTVYTNGENPNVGGRLKVVAKDISEEEAYKLIEEKVDKNINAFLGDMPDELRSPENDAFIANMIKNGSKRDI